MEGVLLKYFVPDYDWLISLFYVRVWAFHIHRLAKVRLAEVVAELLIITFRSTLSLLLDHEYLTTVLPSPHQDNWDDDDIDDEFTTQLRAELEKN